MQGENITCGKQSILIDLLDPFRKVASVLAGAGANVHAELTGDIGNLHTDIAQSHNAKLFACKFH